MNIPPILKNKWVWIGGVGVIVVVMVASSAGGGSSAGGVAASGPSDAEVAAQRDITIATLNAQVQSNAASAEVAKINAQAQAEIATMSVQSQLQRYAIDAQTAIQNLSVTSSRDVQLADIASQERRETTALNMNAQVAKWTLDQATANTQIQADFQLEYAEAANQTQMFLAQTMAETTAAQITASRDVTLAGLATQTNMAAINANLQRDVTVSNNAAQAAIYAGMAASQIEAQRISALAETERTRILAGVEKKKSSNSLIGGIIGGVLGVFSDPRLKRDIVPLGMRSDGLGIYAYNYVWGGQPQIGVMADEVDLLRPDAAGPKVLGFGTVDYARL